MARSDLGANKQKAAIVTLYSERKEVLVIIVFPKLTGVTLLVGVTTTYGFAPRTVCKLKNLLLHPGCSFGFLELGSKHSDLHVRKCQ